MSLKNMIYYLYIGLILLITIPVGSTHAAEATDYLTARTSDNNEITIEVYRAQSDHIFIWHPHEQGIQDIDKQLAAELARNGTEVWLADLLEAWFLPNTASNMDKLPAAAYSALLELASKTGKKIIAAASGRAAIPMLRGIHLWQKNNPKNANLLGAVLLSPKLFVETPSPGKQGSFLPVVKATSIPVVIIQPDKSPWYWKLAESVNALQAGGAEVFIWPLRGVRDRFYFRPDAFEHEKTVTNNLYERLLTATQLLTKLPPANRRAVTITANDPVSVNARKERVLETYQGNPLPPPLELPDLTGKPFNLDTLHGKVVLVNFWATWCPPCVHEMPSMQRLLRHYNGKPFTILGVNMAEDEKTIRKFLTTKVNISFPIVMDIDGKALQNWKVFAFPTSYVLDKQGKIRYALFGGVEWDTPDTIGKIDLLLKE